MPHAVAAAASAIVGSITDQVLVRPSQIEHTTADETNSVATSRAGRTWRWTASEDSAKRPATVPNVENVPSTGRRGRKATNDRLFLEAMHFFTVENVRWRALPERFGHWNSVWRRFDRLSKAGVFEAFFDTLAEMSASAHLIQMFDSTIVRAHVSAAGAKGGSKARRSAARVAGSRRKSTPKRTIQAASSRSI